MRQHFDPLPIVPLGTLDGFVFLIDARHRFHALLSTDLTARRMRDLVQPHDAWLLARFPPRVHERSEYSSELFRAWIFALIARRGIVDAQLLGFQFVRRGGECRWVWRHGR